MTDSQTPPASPPPVDSGLWDARITKRITDQEAFLSSYLASTLEHIAGLVGSEWTGLIANMPRDCRAVIDAAQNVCASRQDWAADAADLEMILSKTLGEPDGALELAGVAPDRTRPEISLDDLLAAEAAKLAPETPENTVIEAADGLTVTQGPSTHPGGEDGGPAAPRVWICPTPEHPGVTAVRDNHDMHWSRVGDRWRSETGHELAWWQVASWFGPLTEVVEP